MKFVYKLYFLISFFLLQSEVSLSQQYKGYIIRYVNYSERNNPVFKNYYIVKGNDTSSVSYEASINLELKQSKENVNGKSVLKVYNPYDTSIKLFKNFNRSFMHFQVGTDLGLFREKQTFVDTVGLFNWRIETQKKLVGFYQCQKATATFRGRNYTAWFSDQIPVRNGPWKIDGLPGLIIEVYDDENLVYWKLESIQFSANLEVEEYNGILNGTYSDFKRILKEKYLRIKKIMESNDKSNDPNCSSCKGSIKTFQIYLPEDIIN